MASNSKRPGNFGGPTSPPGGPSGPPPGGPPPGGPGAWWAQRYAQAGGGQRSGPFGSNIWGNVGQRVREQMAQRAPQTPPAAPIGGPQPLQPYQPAPDRAPIPGAPQGVGFSPEEVERLQNTPVGMYGAQQPSAGNTLAGARINALRRRR